MVKALFNAVIVKPIEQDESTYGTIVVPDMGKEKNLRGEVVSVGPGHYTGMGNFIETTVSNKSDARINSVTVNENSTIIASSYGTYVEFHNATTLELIERFNFGKEIYHIEFSPSGKDVAGRIEFVF